MSPHVGELPPTCVCNFLSDFFDEHNGVCPHSRPVALILVHAVGRAKRRCGGVSRQSTFPLFPEHTRFISNTLQCASKLQDELVVVPMRVIVGKTSCIIDHTSGRPLHTGPGYAPL